MEIKRTQNNKGFSIVEVVISLFILGVVLLIYAAANNTLTLNRIAKHKQLAYRIAASELEGLRAGGYANLPSTTVFSDALLANLPNSSGSLAITTYDARSKQVVVTVTWAEPARSAQSVALTTLIAEGGLGQ